VFLICQVEDLLPQYGNVGTLNEIIKEKCGCGGGYGWQLRLNVNFFFPDYRNLMSLGILVWIDMLTSPVCWILYGWIPCRSSCWTCFDDIFPLGVFCVDICLVFTRLVMYT